MTGDLPPEPPTTEEAEDGADLTAAEYALGVLGPRARALAEARAEKDASFAAGILAWVLRFEPLIGAVAPVEPSAPLWSRIEAAIDRPKDRPNPALSSAANTAFAPPPVPANDPPTRAERLWRTWAVVASAIAAVAVLYVAVRPMLTGGAGRPPLLASRQTERTLLATLTLTATKASAFTVAYDPQQGTLYATPAGDFSLPHARSAELWLIPADGKPRPMGVMDAAKTAAMPMPKEFAAMAREKATLAVSIEPEGGSTTGLPTGPVIATGQFAAV